MKRERDSASVSETQKASLKKEPAKEIENLVIDEKSIREISFMKGSSHISMGTRGIAIHPQQREKLAVLSYDGNFKLGDMKEGKLLQSIQVVKKHSECGNVNSLAFCPSGELIAVSIDKGSSVFIFKTEGSKLVRKLDRESTGQSISRVKWLSENDLVVGTDDPGVVEVFEVGSTSPKMTLRPELTNKRFDGIGDFDFCESKEGIICTGAQFENDSFIIFKMKMAQENQKHEWKHSEHNGPIITVVVSNCGCFVVSGACDNQVIVTRERDGMLLKKQGDWFTKYIYSVVLSPCDRYLLVQTEDEVVLLKWNKDSEGSFEKKQELKKEELNGKRIHSLSVSWNPRTIGEHSIFFGMRGGSVFQGVLMS